MSNERSSCNVLIAGKRTAEYVFDALARLNAGAQQVKLCGVGVGIAKAAEVANILTRNFGIAVTGSQLVTYTRGEVSFTGLEITVESVGTLVRNDYAPSGFDNFIEYPIYHLLLSALLRAENKIVLKIKMRPGHHQEAITIVRDHHQYKLSVAHSLTEPNVGKKKRSEILEEVAAALSRSGILLSRSWNAVCTALCRDDDVVLGLDTNILRECILTQQLLDGFILHSPQGSSHSPNWSLLIIPNGVMHEIEQIANSREHEGGGKLTRQGRLGYRALAEILEIDQGRDLGGISLLVVGEANPVLDARVELRGLRTDMARSATGPEIILKKLSAGDTHIRDQFKQFLRQISFHKGTYFLTADKSNSALARAEGLRCLYYASAPPRAIQESEMVITMPRVLDHPGPLLTIPLGKIIFELAVQFEEVCLSVGSSNILLQCDVTGESLVNWVYKRLMIKPKDLKILLDVYASTAKFSLTAAEETWHRLNERLMDEDYAADNHFVSRARIPEGDDGEQC